jgi:2,5-diamino-6-(ribosylamino)-4(3H)-pyrimidinone 5'-phosphate reductase
VLPRVIIHITMSLDGRIDWGFGDEGLYYQLASHWPVDAMLSGSNTMLVAHLPEEIPEEMQQVAEEFESKGDDRQLLVIVDSRGRLRNWHLIKNQPWWRDAIALCSEATDPGYLEYLREQEVETIIAGDDKVDLRSALKELKGSYGVEVVRVDSGGILNGALLRAGLVDEVSVIINPELVGGASPRSIFVAEDLTSQEGVIRLRLEHLEEMGNGVIWLRYEVEK